DRRRVCGGRRVDGEVPSPGGARPGRRYRHRYGGHVLVVVGTRSRADPVDGGNGHHGTDSARAALVAATTRIGRGFGAASAVASVGAALARSRDRGRRRRRAGGAYLRGAGASRLGHDFGFLP